MAGERSALDVLFASDVFSGLEPVIERRLRAALRFHRLRPGDVIIEEGEEGSHFFALVRGEVAVSVRGRLVRLVEGPRILGLVSLVDRQRRSASLRAFTDVELFSLERERFFELMRASEALDHNILRYFARELREQYAADERTMRHFDDFFESPKAQLVPGPYYADPFDMYVFVMEDEPARLAALMPPGLTPLPGMAGRYLVTFNFFRRVYTRNPVGAGKDFAYNEMTPFVPCVGPRFRAGLFVPELYPDNYLAITLGRELYGFPKRFGLIDRGARRADLILDAHVVLRSTWSGEQPVTPARFMARFLEVAGGDGLLPRPLEMLAGAFFDLMSRDLPRRAWPAMPVFVHKQIPDCVSETQRLLEIDELVEIPFRITHLGPFHELDGPVVRFLDEDYFLGGHCRGGFRLEMGFGFGKGHEWIDYKRRRGRRAGAVGGLPGGRRRFGRTDGR